MTNSKKEEADTTTDPTAELLGLLRIPHENQTQREF